MNWRPWRRAPAPEQRSTAQGYTAGITAAFVAGAEGGVESAPLATAALEAASGLYARCMAAAVVKGPPAAVRALTPPVLALIARNLIRRGEDYHRIYVRSGVLTLEPVGFAFAHGNGPDPMGWTYNATIYGPTDSRHEWVPETSMLHTRYSIDASRPWLGVPPWSWAAATGQAIAALDRLISREAAASHGALLGVPPAGAPADGSTTDPLTAFRDDVGTARGKTLVIEDTRTWEPAEGQGRAGQSAAIQHHRFGFPLDAAAAVRTDVGRDVLGACGVPPTLFVANSDGTAQRESFRRFLHASLRPVARIMETELRLKLDMPDLVLDLSETNAADIAGKARAWSGFVKGRMDPRDATRFCNLGDLEHPLTAPKAPAGPPV